MARGFFAELQHQSQIAAKRRVQAERAASREYAAAQRRAEQTRKQYERAQVQQARASAAEQKAIEREAKRLHEEARLAEVASLNAQLAEKHDQICSILLATLAVDDFVDLVSTAGQAAIPAWDPGRTRHPRRLQPLATPRRKKKEPLPSPPGRTVLLRTCPPTSPPASDLTRTSGEHRHRRTVGHRGEVRSRRNPKAPAASRLERNGRAASSNQGQARLTKKRTPSTIKANTTMPTIPIPPRAASISFLLRSVPTLCDSQAKTCQEHREHQRHHRPEESHGLTQLLPQGVVVSAHGHFLPSAAERTNSPFAGTHGCTQLRVPLERQASRRRGPVSPAPPSYRIPTKARFNTCRASPFP